VVSSVHLEYELLKLEKQNAEINGLPVTRICKIIRAKYGKVERKGKYYHAGKGDWIKHSVSQDRTQKAKPAKSIKQLQKYPQSYDGIEAAKIGTVKAGTTLKDREGRLWKINSRKKSGNNTVYSLTTKGSNMKLNSTDFSKKVVIGDLKYMKLILDDFSKEQQDISKNYSKAFRK